MRRSTSSRSLRSVSSSTSDEDNTIIVWVHGATIGGRKAGYKAGWAVSFLDPALSHLNEMCRLSGLVQTANRAELTAMIRAIQLCPNDGRKLLIQSSSNYCVKSIKRWIKEWRKNGWLTKQGEPVKNQDLIVQLEDQRCSRRPRPQFEYFKYTYGVPGFDTVQGMAKEAAALPRTDGYDSADEASNDVGEDEVFLK